MEWKSNKNVKAEDCDKTRIKQEHFHQDETESQNLHLQQNDKMFVACNKSNDVDTKIGIKQETWDPNVVSTDIKSDSEKSPALDPVPFIDTGAVMGGGEVLVKEETCWGDETSADLINKEKVGASCVDVSATVLRSTFSRSSAEQQNHVDNGSISAENSDGKYECKTYGKKFKLSHLQKHNFVHKECKCELCKGNSKQLHDLKRDVSNHGDEKLYKCEICDRSFKWFKNLKPHILSHSDKRQYKCEICGKSFRQLSGLKIHILVHDDTKLYKCDICEKSFKWLQNLKPHLLIHDEKRQYKCEICGKRFKQIGGLKTHLLVHGDKKQHKCEICEKSFKRLSVLKRHVLIHDEVRDHKCDICGRTFSQLGHLKTHLVTHDNKRHHQCNICGRSFKLLQHLKRHLLLHSGK